MKPFCVLTCLLLAVFSTGANPVSFIKKCLASDSKCAKESAQAAIPIYTVGLPELGVEPLDPMFIAKMDASKAGLKLLLTDMTVRGLKGCQVKKLERDDEKSKLFVKAQCDVTLDGQYEMDGNLLIVPIQGKGAVHALLRKLVITADIDLSEKIKDGKKHWNIKSFKHAYELKDKADVVFENLFKDNEVLGRAARDLISNNGNEIIDEVGSPVVKSVVVGLVKNVNKFFSKVPVEDLSLD